MKWFIFFFIYGTLPAWIGAILLALSVKYDIPDFLLFRWGDIGIFDDNVARFLVPMLYFLLNCLFQLFLIARRKANDAKQTAKG